MTALGQALARELLAVLRDDPELRAELRGLLTADGGERREPQRDWYSLAEAADYLRVSPRTVERLVATGQLPTSTVGRRRLAHRRDLAALAAAGRDTLPVAASRRGRTV
ncbi:MAG: helix-turn-helix domain-containing protein [Rhodospirillales bacterium]|nr:helix-turn-helix domain-containing protein [Rhodospirillales bacterium]